MKISDGRINSLSRKIASSLLAEGLVVDSGVDKLAAEIKKGFNLFIQEVMNIDTKVRKKIASLKRGVPEGSAEFEILYRQYYNEETDKM